MRAFFYLQNYSSEDNFWLSSEQKCLPDQEQQTQYRFTRLRDAL